MQFRSDLQKPDQELADRVFRGKGELARLCRAMDWSDTPLGAITSWPASLQVIAALVVAARQPMIVLWGPELVQIYNDGYCAVMGKRHPSGLGQPTRQCWPEVWEFNAPLYRAVVERCESFVLEDQPLAIERNDCLEEAFFTVCFSPAIEVDGDVGGVLVTVSETTAAVKKTHAEMARNKSEERLRVALEAAELGTWDLDLTTDTAAVRSLRHDQIFGYEKHQAQWGQEIAMRHVLPEDRPLFQEAFTRAMETGILSCEVRVRWPDGSLRWIAPLARTEYDESGRPVRMAGVVADVTERNRAIALRESEERFRLMADATPQIVWVTDAEGQVEFFNQHWEKYTGMAYEQKTAAAVAAAVVHPDDVAITTERFEQAQRSGSTYAVEHRIRSMAGEYRWFLVRAEPYRDPLTGEISRWFGTSVDIHDLRQAEKNWRLLGARQAFQLALADRIRPLPDPDDVTAAANELLGQALGASRVIYGEVDESGEYIELNRDWTDGTLSSMAGLRLMMNDFGPAVVSVVRAGQVLAVADVAKNRDSAPYAEAYLANGIRAALAIPLMKNGRLRAVLGIHDSAAHDWTDNDIAMAQDMVDRTWSALESARAQARLRIERDRMQSLFAGMTEGLALIAPDWTMLEVNAEGLRIAQRTRSEVIGKSYWEVWREAAGPDGERMYRQVMETRKPGALEYQQRFADGHIAWIEVRAYAAGNHDLAVFFRDFTHRKSTEQKLKDTDRRKDEFLAMLAHELRNPLAPIGAAAELLQIAKLDEAQVRRTSQIIGRQVGHMTHLVNDLLDVSRVTRGMVKLDTTPLDIRFIVSEAVEQVTPLIQSRRHQLALHMQPDTTIVIGDKNRLVQVLTNLLNNAAKYTNEGGNILLKTNVCQSQVVIEVIDNGIGMSADLVAHAFDLFAQGERSSDRSAGGLGIGLALAKSLVELHAGTVSCESEGLGKGSKFTVCLPRLVEQERHDMQHGPEASVEHSRTSLKIMVVDDNRDAATMLAMLLEASGHDVVVAYGSRQALELARSDTFEVCLLDIGLPEMDGNELAQQLRIETRTAKAILIAVTGYGQERDREQAFTAGFDHHLIKPVDTKKLISILSGIRKA